MTNCSAKGCGQEAGFAVYVEFQDTQGIPLCDYHINAFNNSWKLKTKTKNTGGNS